MTPPTTDSEYVNESGDPVQVGEHGEHDFVFASGEPLTDAGQSDLVFESGTGIGGGEPVDVPSDAFGLVTRIGTGSGNGQPTWPIQAGPLDGSFASSGRPGSDVRPRWATEYEFSGAMHAGDGKVFAIQQRFDGPGGSSDLVLAAFDATTGKKLWENRGPDANGLIRPHAVAIHEGSQTLYCLVDPDVTKAGVRRRLIGIDTESGDTVVTGPIFEETLLNTREGLTYCNGVVLAMRTNSFRNNTPLVALDDETGDVRYKTQREDITVDGRTVNSFVQSSRSITTDGDAVYLHVVLETKGSGNYVGQGTVKVDASTGNRIWFVQDYPEIAEVRRERRRAMVHYGGNIIYSVYLLGSEGDTHTIRARSASTGGLDWSVSIPESAGNEFKPPDAFNYLAESGGVALGNRGEYWRAFDADTGSLIAQQYGNGEPPIDEFGKRISFNGNELYTRRQGSLLCYDVTTFEQKWSLALNMNTITDNVGAWVCDDNSIYACTDQPNTEFWEPYV